MPLHQLRIPIPKRCLTTCYQSSLTLCPVLSVPLEEFRAVTMSGPQIPGYLPQTMTRTPWGDAASLRERKLRPGRGTPRAEAERNQRERLFAAMVATVAEKGYEATTVADLVKLSGVSRSAFYRHFEDKQACFLAAVDQMIGPALERLGGDESAPAGVERARKAFEGLIELI